MDHSPFADIEQIVSRQLKTGRFTSVSEVLHTAVLLLDADVNGRSSNSAAAKRSLRGLLADLPCDVSYADFREARHSLSEGRFGLDAE